MGEVSAGERRWTGCRRARDDGLRAVGRTGESWAGEGLGCRHTLMSSRCGAGGRGYGVFGVGSIC